MSRLRVSPATLTITVLVGLSTATLYACDDTPVADRTTALSAARADVEVPGQHREYGVPVRVGNARARTYVVLDERAGGTPLEIGVALDGDALEGLPAPMPTQGHFDFQFYNVDRATRDGIDPTRMSEAEYAARSAAFPSAPEVPPFYVPLVMPGTPPRAEARMGMHWGDVRSPELQVIVGNPTAYRPFTTTFFRGSWDGRFIFDEPMITRDFLLARRAAQAPAERDSVMALPTAASYTPAGFHPAGYHVGWDEQAREYRVGLTALVRHD